MTKSHKLCRECGEYKLLTEFYKNRTTKDGHQDWCKVCQCEYEKKRRSSTLPVSSAKSHSRPTRDSRYREYVQQVTYLVAADKEPSSSHIVRTHVRDEDGKRPSVHAIAKRLAKAAKLGLVRYAGRTTDNCYQYVATAKGKKQYLAAIRRIRNAS